MRVPAALAAANGFADGAITEVAADAMAAVLRQSADARKSLVNLPLLRPRSLQAFDLRVQGAVPDVSPAAKQVVRGEVLPMGNLGAVRIDLCEKTGTGADAKQSTLARFVMAVSVDHIVVLTRIQDQQPLFCG